MRVISPSLFVFPVCVYGGVVRHFLCVLDLCVSFVSCVVMMSGCVFYASVLVQYFYSINIINKGYNCTQLINFNNPLIQRRIYFILKCK